MKHFCVLALMLIAATLRAQTSRLHERPVLPQASASIACSDGASSVEAALEQAAES